MPENQRSCKRIGLFVVVLFGALWQLFDFYTDLKSVVTYKKACSECSGNGTQSTLLGKVSILGVESLLSFSAWLFQEKLELNKITWKLEILHWNWLYLWNKKKSTDFQYEFLLWKSKY